jgi:hypothetical protein
MEESLAPGANSALRWIKSEKARDRASAYSSAGIVAETAAM